MNIWPSEFEEQSRHHKKSRKNKYILLKRYKPERFKKLLIAKIFCSNNEWRIHKRYATIQDRQKAFEILSKRDDILEYKVL